MSQRVRHHLVALACLVIGASAQAACSVPLAEREAKISNRCNDDTDCGASARCVENTCVATQADIGELVLEVEVPSTSPYGPSTTHVVAPADEPHINLTGDDPSGYFEFYSIYLPELVDVRVALEIDNLPAACGALADENGLVPIRAELTQTQAAFGAIPRGVATRIYDAVTPDEATDNAVTITVPEGAYDIYITPQIPTESDDPEMDLSGCILPPRLIRDRDIRDGELHETLSYNAENPGERGSVEGINLEGWTVALIENEKGRLVSDVYELNLVQDDTPNPFTLHYWPENGQDGIVLRLTPPADQAATGGMPVFYWVLANLPTNAVTVASLRDVDPIDISGGVLDENFDKSVPATITIHSETLDIDFGENVIYRRTVETDADGGFSGFKLLPGTYRFVIQPAVGDDLAITEQQFVVSAASEGSHGQSVSVRKKLNMTGAATTNLGAPASKVNAVLEAALPDAGTYLQNVQRTLPVLPSSTSTFTNSDGLFSLLIDRGTFNLSLRPEPSSDLPWTVVSRYHIEPEQTELDDISLEIAPPVMLIGQVRSQSPSFTIGNARIRAWLRPTQLETESTSEPAAIQIAETTTLPSGEFRLVLPGSLATISQ